jgi:diaminopimelate epimerase
VVTVVERRDAVAPAVVVNCDNGTMVSTDPDRPLVLGKHEGAGNDFLVLLDPDDDRRLGAAVVRALCDRHRGVGADGVIRVTRGRAGADLAMELRNADGGTAEMSGNGMRCLAQAAVDGGLVAGPLFTVATAAGVRHVEYRPTAQPGVAWASVDMGVVRLDGEPANPGLGDTEQACLADVGNPHLVLLVPDPEAVDVPGRGGVLAAGVPGGINVEFIARRPGSEDALDLRVWERGAGETLACGTGSVAAAAVARAWGLVGDRVRVHNPGGVLDVALGAGADDSARLGGPVRKVADVEVAWPVPA